MLDNHFTKKIYKDFKEGSFFEKFGPSVLFAFLTNYFDKPKYSLAQND